MNLENLENVENFLIFFTENCENDTIYVVYLDIIRIIYREALVDIENSNIREPTEIEIETKEDNKRQT